VSTRCIAKSQFFKMALFW